MFLLPHTTEIAESLRRRNQYLERLFREKESSESTQVPQATTMPPSASPACSPTDHAQPETTNSVDAPGAPHDVTKQEKPSKKKARFAVVEEDASVPRHQQSVAAPRNKHQPRRSPAAVTNSSMNRTVNRKLSWQARVEVAVVAEMKGLAKKKSKFLLDTVAPALYRIFGVKNEWRRALPSLMNGPPLCTVSTLLYTTDRGLLESHPSADQPAAAAADASVVTSTIDHAVQQFKSAARSSPGRKPTVCSRVLVVFSIVVPPLISQTTECTCSWMTRFNESASGNGQATCDF